MARPCRVLTGFLRRLDRSYGSASPPVNERSSKLLLTLIAHAATPAIRRAAFASPHDALDPVGERAAAAKRSVVRRVDLALTSPVPAARQTAAALGLTADVEPGLRELDYGRWAGQTLDRVAAVEPDAVAAWLSDPAAAPHGGDCLLALLGRISDWLRELGGEERRVAVTHGTVLRAAVVAVLSAPPMAFWRIDAGPLTRVDLRGAGGRWTLIRCERLRS